MARKTTGTTVAVSDLNDIFDTNSFDGMGDQRYPRVSSNISINSHFRSRQFFKFNTVRDAAQGANGTVQVNSPVSLTANGAINTINYVFDGNTYSSITVQANEEYGNVFERWQGRVTDTGTATTLSTSNPATLSFTNIWSYNFIEAVFTSDVILTCPNLSLVGLSEGSNGALTGTIGLNGNTYDSITLQFSFNSGTYFNGAEQSLSGGANSFFFQGCGFYYFNGDSVTARARGNCSNGVSSDWTYSNSVTITGCDLVNPI